MMAGASQDLQLISPLIEAFHQHARENRGAFASRRQAETAAQELAALAERVVLPTLPAIAGTAAGDAAISALEIEEAAHVFAARGLAISTGRAMLQALANTAWLSQLPPEVQPEARQRFTQFQLSFLAHLATAREELNQRNHEQSLVALQSALHLQLQQQRDLREEQEQRNQALQRILHLNANLARIKEEDELLAAAANHITDDLNLNQVAIFEWERTAQQWELRATTGTSWPNTPPQEPVAGLLQKLQEGKNDLLTVPAGDTPSANGQTSANIMAARLYVGKYTLGVLLAVTHAGHNISSLLLNTFALNLAAHWRNIQLFRDARNRARELEILHGRYIDDIWQSSHTQLQATFADDTIQLRRSPAGDGSERPAGDGSTPQFPLLVGDQPLGQLSLPANKTLTAENEAFIQALTREMGSALYNARLIQTMRAYSSQLQAAAEVSQVISTLLDRSALMAEVVNLIQRRFGFHHVGLFMLENEMAVLRAATDPAGKQLLREGYKIPVRDSTVVCSAIRDSRPAVVRDVHHATHFRPPPSPLASTQAQVALPLRARDTVLGALDVHSTEIGAFTTEEIAVLQTLAEQVAVALNNADLFAQVQESYQKFNQLYQAGRGISEAHTPAEIGQALVDYAAASQNVDLAFIVGADPESADFLRISNLWSRYGLPLFYQQERFQREYFPFSDRLAENKRFLISDGQNDPMLDRHTRRLFERNSVRAAAVIPLHIDEQWLASLVIARASADAFQEEELQPFLNLAGQASVALANQLLLRETNALYKISRELSQALTAEEALELTLIQVAKYTGISPCRVVQYDQDSLTGRVTATYDLATDSTQTTQPRLRFPTEDDTLYASLTFRRQPLQITAATAASYPTAARYLAELKLEAAVFIPIIIQQQLNAILVLDSTSGLRPFSRTNLNFATNAVAQLTTFLENITLFAETTRQARDLIELNQIGTRLSGILNLDELLTTLHRELSRLLDTELFWLAQYHPHDGQFSTARLLADGVPQEPISGRVPAESPLEQFLLSDKMPQREEVPKLLAPLGIPLLSDRPSALWVQLREESRPAGWLLVQSSRPNAYRDNDAQVLRSVATHASLAISNARLFQQTQENVAEFRLLFTISQAATGSVDAGQRLSNMVEALHAGMRRASVVIYALDPAEDCLQAIGSRGSDRDPGPLRIGLAANISGQVARLGQSLLVNDLRELPEYQVELASTLSQLSVPLIVGQRTIGVVSIYSQAANAFTDRDLRLLETLSVSLAATVESTRLFENIQATNERLRELDRLKTRFLANMTHELRTPLNAIIGFSRVILKGIDGPITPEQEEDLTAINSSGQHLLTLINDILDLAKIEAGKVTLVIEPVDLPDLVDSVLATVRGLIEDRPVNIEWHVAPDVPPIAADVVRLRQIMLNLLSNAAKYTEAGTIRCHITRENADFVHILVADTGIGIDQKDYDRLFKAFEQADSTARTVQGTGLGLPITQSLVEMHHGRIWFESELGQGTTFHILLPIWQPDLLPGPGRDDLATLQPIHE